MTGKTQDVGVYFCGHKVNGESRIIFRELGADEREEGVSYGDRRSVETIGDPESERVWKRKLRNRLISENENGSEEVLRGLMLVDEMGEVESEWKRKLSKKLHKREGTLRSLTRERVLILESK